MEVATTKLGQSFGGTNDTQKSVFDLVDFAGDLTVEDANRSSERNPVLQMRRSSHGFLGLISLIVFEHMDWVLSPTNVFGGGYRQSQEQTHLIPMQVQEQLNQHKVQMEMQVKEMMDAMFSQMQGTIQAQQARIEQLESQQTMGSNIKGRRRRRRR